MRARLLAQLNQVLQTRDSARGLIVNMPDVLFDTGQYSLKPAARERLARISGIVLAYPDLKLEIEGHTDSIGGDAYNQRLSEKRAASVRDYLVNSRVSINNTVARGLGKSEPVADNKTAAGRKLNRRVEMIVSGDVIGDLVGQQPSADSQPVAPPSAQPSNPQ
jgi:outer membrane protein OmpA-like peptidoglycan-associated protein